MMNYIAQEIMTSINQGEEVLFGDGVFEKAL